MDMIYKTVLAVIIVVCIAAGGTSSIRAGVDANNINNYFDDLTSTIAESNYSQTVINECIAEAASNGYTLTVKVVGSTEPGMMRYAEAELEYLYEIPLFGVSETKTKHKII